MDWGSPSIDHLEHVSQNKGIKLTFPPGERCFMGNSGYQLTYLLKCDMSKELEFETIVKSATCNYEYHFNSKYGCSDTFIHPGSWYSSKRILLYLVIMLCLYCAGFSFLNYKLNPEDGMVKAFPHREFWKTFFDDAISGAKIVYSKAREKIKGDRSNYESY
jgi:hypothetical protein